MKIREYQTTDMAAVQFIWQQAFTGPPWHEQLGQSEMTRRWKACLEKRGFGCLLMEHNEQVVGFISWHTPTLEELCVERGSELAHFTRKFNLPLVWLTITCTHPSYQGQGVARRLRQNVISIFQEGTEAHLLLTRHHQDNTAIISLSRSMGFIPTDIRTPSLHSSGLSHQYWYRVPKKNDSNCGNASDRPRHGV